ncbi:MAG TPA: peptidase S15, partial [Thermoleophilia bacterium]|nr:peptidase S15 [Thermoleophilia bacterium]
VYHYALTEGDQLSAVVRATCWSDLKRGAELDVRVETVSELRADATHFELVDDQVAYDHGEEFYRRRDTRRVPRDLV